MEPKLQAEREGWNQGYKLKDKDGTKVTNWKIRMEPKLQTER